MALLYLLLVLAAADLGGGAGSAALTVAAYAVAAVLVLTVEGWLRLRRSPPARLPEALSVEQSRRFVAVAALGAYALTVAFWVLASRPSGGFVGPFSLSPRGQTLQMLSAALLRLPLTAFAVVLSVMRWGRGDRGPLRLDLQVMALALTLLALDVGLTQLIGLVSGMRLGASFGYFQGYWPVGFLLVVATSGFPQAVIYQGIVLRDLITWLGGRPVLACLAAMLAFNAAQAASLAAGHVTASGVRDLMLGIVLPGQPAGLLLGYLFLRTRSLIPGMALIGLMHLGAGII
jgi:hypothetical protein